MNFFDYIKNESFFKPLTFKYRRIYYDCIRILIDRSKELPVLYESDAKDSITLYLKNEEIQRLIEEADDGMRRCSFRRLSFWPFSVNVDGSSHGRSDAAENML